MRLDDALARVQAAIAPLFPVSPPRPLNLNIPDQESFVFRNDLGENGSIIAKVAAPGRLAAQFDRLQKTHSQMRNGQFRVPKPISYDEDTGVLLLEDAWGMAAESLWLNGARGPARVLATAGGWLARYHALSASQAPFNPDPHLSWLGKSLIAHQDGHRRIPQVRALTAHLPELEIRAERARAATSLRCVTHRDFHLRNLLIRKNDRAYGIDMENAARDEAMRDMLFFLADTARATPEPPTPAALHHTARALRQAYGGNPADPAARLFFQHAFALNLWAGLHESPVGLSPKQHRGLQTAQALLACDDLFPDLQAANQPTEI
jgi:hypothetical protein